MESRRLQKEYEEICKLNQSDNQYAVTARMVGNNMTHWKGTIRGPVIFKQEDTAYDGGFFLLDI